MRDDTTSTFVNRAQFDNSAQARSGSGSAPRPSARANIPLASDMAASPRSAAWSRRCAGQEFTDERDRDA
ncbi:hypothetical protein [Streptomyces canus]|uniref:hypothetical protein n=1 Tax=Streptomyces canus TaxID=58343 RepID=UPI003850D3B8